MLKGLKAKSCGVARSSDRARRAQFVERVFHRGRLAVFPRNARGIERVS